MVDRALPHSNTEGTHTRSSARVAQALQHSTTEWASHLEREIPALCQKGQLDKALHVLYHMDRLGLSAPTHVYIALLTTCGMRQALAGAQQIHAHLSRHHVELTGPLGHHLLITLLDCGDLDGAWHVLLCLKCRTAYLWAALISNFVRSGLGREALKMYKSMEEDGVIRNRSIFLSLLKACASLGDLREARKLHTDVLIEGFDFDVFIGSTLVTTYGKCGSIADAESVFKKLSNRNVVCWNAMLTAYVEHKQGGKVLLLYRQMQVDGLNSNEQTFLITLQACIALAENEEVAAVKGQTVRQMSIHIGKALHCDAQRKGFSSDAFIGNVLVGMYGKCGNIVEAESMFTELSQLDTVSWNAVLSAYLEQGQGDRALLCYTQMQWEGVSSNRQTCTIILQACANFVEKEQSTFEEGQCLKVRSLEIGLALHADAWRNGFDSDVFIGSILVNVYGKCGNIVEAENVFNGLSGRDVVCWSAMLSAYIEQGQQVKTLLLFRQMLEEAVKPDKQTFAAAIHACHSLLEREQSVLVWGLPTEVMSLEIGQALHADARRKDFVSDVFVANNLVCLYGKCRRIGEAAFVFDGLTHRNVVTWTAMISAYFEQVDHEKALQFYMQMQKEGVSSNQEQTFVITLQACSALLEKDNRVSAEEDQLKVMAVAIGKAIHADASKQGFSGIFYGNTLLSMHAKCGSILELENIFENLSQRDVVSWNTMLSALVEQGYSEKASQLYKAWLVECATLTETTIMRFLKACSEMGMVEICRDLHFFAVFAGYDRDPVLVNSLIHAYGTCASRSDALVVFAELYDPDVVSWNACIDGYAQKGDLLDSMLMLEGMQLSVVSPNEVTFLSLLSTCSHTGLVSEGIQYLESMCKKYFLFPELKHYIVMVDLFGRAGDFESLQCMLLQMPMQPDMSTWLRLLAACRTHGNVELAQAAFDSAESLQPKDGTIYTLMSNIYAAAGLQEGTKKVLDMTPG